MVSKSQTIKDRFLALKYSLKGNVLAKTVCKATTEETHVRPKKKHLDYLLSYTYELEASIPTMADLLLKRSVHTSWVVVYKSLATIHCLLGNGNKKFIQYLASRKNIFQLSNFQDTSSDYGYIIGSEFVRKYSNYLSEKLVAYRKVPENFCSMKHIKSGGKFKTMSVENLLKTLPVLQAQIDALMKIEFTSLILKDDLIHSSFLLLYKELLGLFASYNDGMIKLLENYSDLEINQAREALDRYLKFIRRMPKVAVFVRLAKDIGIVTDTILDLSKIPRDLSEALKVHLASLEGKQHEPPKNSEYEAVEENRLVTETMNDETAPKDETEAKDENVLINDGLYDSSTTASDEKPEIFKLLSSAASSPSSRGRWRQNGMSLRISKSNSI